MSRKLGSLTLLVLACACSSDDPLAPAIRPPGEATAAGATRLAVLTRNLYVGADVDAVIAALVSPSPDDDLAALSLAVQTLQRTDFPSRARAIADEVARTRPHALGLQEVSEIHLDLPRSTSR